MTLIDKASDSDSITAKAFVFGGTLAGAPVAIACLPLTAPIALDGGYKGLGIIFAPGVPTFVAGGLALAAPVAVLDLLIGTPIRAWKRRNRSRYEAQPKRRPSQEMNEPLPPPANGPPLPAARARWAPKPPPRLRLRAGAGPPICEPAVKRDIEQGVELEERLIPLRKGR